MAEPRDRTTVLLVSDASLTRSGHCAREVHAECPHFASGAGRGSLWRPRPSFEWTFVVCACDCHAGCALAGQRTARREEWRQRCTCAGAARVRHVQERALQRRKEVATVLAGVGREGRWQAEEVEARLRGVFQAHEETPPPGLTGLSRALVAANARPGTRTPRLLWMAGRGIGAVVRWAWRPAGAEPRAEHNRAVSRAGFRSVGVMAAAAAMVTVAATRSSGRRRRMWVFVGAVFWLATGWAGVLVTGVSQLARLAEEHALNGAGRENGHDGGLDRFQITWG
jgi:hypothetical protein